MAVAVARRVVRERRKVHAGQDPVAEVRAARLDARVDEGNRRRGADRPAAASAVSVMFLPFRSLAPELVDSDHVRPELARAEAGVGLMPGVEHYGVVDLLTIMNTMTAP